MPKKKHQAAANVADAPRAKKGCGPEADPITCIIYGRANCRTAVARCLAKELRHATVVAISHEAAKEVLPKAGGGAFETREYASAEPGKAVCRYLISEQVTYKFNSVLRLFRLRACRAPPACARHFRSHFSNRALHISKPCTTTALGDC